MKNKINLGCGFDYKERYINCDLRKTVKADKYFDMNIFPYPFKDNSVDEVVMSHILEHLDNVVEVLTEVYRICKKGAIVKIDTPYFSSESAFSDIEHKHFFTYTTLDAVDRSNPIHFRNPFCNKVNFKIIKKKLNWRKQLFFFEIFNLCPRLYQELFPYIFPARSISYVLEAVK